MAPPSRKCVPPCPAGRLCGVTSLRVKIYVFVRSVSPFVRTSSWLQLQTSVGPFLTSSDTADLNLGILQPAQALPSRRVVLLVQHRDLKLAVKPRLVAAGGCASCAKCIASSIYSFCVVALTNEMRRKKGRTATSVVKTLDVHQPQRHDTDRSTQTSDWDFNYVFSLL
jgi:hypothetical protein